MLKIRYFKVKLPTVTGLRSIVEAAVKISRSGAVEIVASSSSELNVRYTSVRQLVTVQYLSDGSSVPGVASTMERHSIRIFSRPDYFIFSIIEPPRGNWLVGDLIIALFGKIEQYTEPLEIGQRIIDRHISCFNSARLVSAKVRDIPIYEKAIARLEITSKEGLQPGIAPFLEGKYHRIDSMTFEIVSNLNKGLITYLSNGTLRISNVLVDDVFPLFETQIT